MEAKNAVLLGCLLVTACSHVAEPPPIQTFRFDRWVANYRSYADDTICEAEPRWLFDELTSVNGVFVGFLKASERPERGYDARALTMLEEAPGVLTQLAKVHAENVQLTKGCSFASQRGFPAVLEKGETLAAEVSTLLTKAPSLVARERALAALARWRTNREGQELSARLSCNSKAPTAPRGGVEVSTLLTKAPSLVARERALAALARWRTNREGQELSARLSCNSKARNTRRGLTPYYAFEDEAGRTSWMFCDGAKVISDGTSESFEAPKGLTRAQSRSVKPESYLEAAREYSKERISRPPAVPPLPTVVADRPAGS